MDGHSDGVSARDDSPFRRLLSRSTTAVLRRTLSAYRHGWWLDEHFRRAARMVCDDARGTGLSAEEILRSLKREWGELLDAQAITDWRTRFDLMHRLVGMCIEEHYARRHRGRPSRPARPPTSWKTGRGVAYLPRSVALVKGRG